MCQVSKLWASGPGFLFDEEGCFLPVPSSHHGLVPGNDEISLSVAQSAAGSLGPSVPMYNLCSPVALKSSVSTFSAEASFSGPAPLQLLGCSQRLVRDLGTGCLSLPVSLCKEARPQRSLLPTAHSSIPTCPRSQRGPSVSPIPVPRAQGLEG